MIDIARQRRNRYRLTQCACLGSNLTFKMFGQRGVKLSGGQIQRIGIAREIYREPELLILDEATNSLDQENETIIFNNLKQLKRKITIIIISHSKNTLKICDNILDLNIKNDIKKN